MQIGLSWERPNEESMSEKRSETSPKSARTRPKRECAKCLRGNLQNSSRRTPITPEERTYQMRTLPHKRGYTSGPLRKRCQGSYNARRRRKLKRSRPVDTSNQQRGHENKPRTSANFPLLRRFTSLFPSAVVYRHCGGGGALASKMCVCSHVFETFKAAWVEYLLRLNSAVALKRHEHGNRRGNKRQDRKGLYKNVVIPCKTFAKSAFEHTNAA